MNVSKENNTYYARLNVDQMAMWGRLKKDFQNMKFLENLHVQGAMPGQILLSFSYTKSPSELIKQLDDSGWIWIQGSSENLGTLKRKE